MRIGAGTGIGNRDVYRNGDRPMYMYGTGIGIGKGSGKA